MFKKTLIASAVLAASTGVALANGGSYTPAKPQSAYNVYVGAGASRDFFNYEENINGVKEDEGGLGWNGDLFTGVGYTFKNHYYIAGEIFGSMSSAKRKYDEDGVKGELKTKYSYGISLIPGIKVTNNIMMYGRVGLNRIKIEDTLNKKSTSKTKNGLQLGLGVQTMVANNVSVRMEYDWTHVGNVKMLKGEKFTGNQVKFQVAYHFENLI
jgi:opacity protein-like surface antigen